MKLPARKHSTSASTFVVVSVPHVTVKQPFVVGADGVTSFAWVHNVNPPATSEMVGGTIVRIAPRVTPKFGSASRIGRATDPIVGRSYWIGAGAQIPPAAVIALRDVYERTNSLIFRSFSSTLSSRMRSSANWYWPRTTVNFWRGPM